MHRAFPIAIFCISFFIVGCNRLDVSKVLQECKELQAVNDQKSWKSIHTKLKAVRADKRMTENTPNKITVDNFYVMSLIRTADTDDWVYAQKVADEVQKTNPNNFLANYQLGKIHHAMGNPAQAYPFLEEAINRKNPVDINAMTLLLDAAEQGGIPGAGKYFEKAKSMEIFKKKPEFYNLWGLWLIKQGGKPNYYAAVTKFNQAMKLDENSPQISLNIAVLYDDYLRLPRAAVGFYKRHKDALRRNSDLNTAENHIPAQRRIRALSRQLR